MGSRAIYNSQMLDKASIAAGLGHEFVRKLALSATTLLVVVIGNTGAAPQSAAAETLLSAPNLSDGDSGKRVQPKSNQRSPTAPRTDEHPKDWTSPPGLAPGSDASWNTLDTSLNADLGGGDRPNKFKYAPSSLGPASSFDRLKLGDGYLGLETQRRLLIPVPWQSADCASVEECEDYSGLPKSKPSGSSGSGSGLGRIRKPFIGLSITRPIQ